MRMKSLKRCKERKETDMTAYVEFSDDVLVEKTLLGDDRAYEELVVRNESAVRGTAMKITGNRFLAEDASQDAFVSAWMHLSSLREQGKFGSWVCSIAKNCARRITRDYQSMEAAISLELVDYLDLEGSGEDALSMQIEDREASQELHDAVNALGEKIRETIRLHYFDGLSVDEIALKLQVPAGTVKWRLSEGRKQLRKGYGIMEKAYDEKESLKARVMRQVETLKLWGMKNDKTGFEEDYRKVLSAVEGLEESKEKNHAMADVLLRGYWWIPGAANDEMMARIKKAAEEGHNDDVMQMVMAHEWENYRGRERIEHIQKVMIPYLEERNFVKSLGYVWFWMGRYHMELEEYKDALAAFLQVTKILTPADVYYANALSAYHVIERKQNGTGEKGGQIGVVVTGESYRYVDGKLYFWQQPGFSQDLETDRTSDIFWNCSACDGLIFDPDLKPGEKRLSSDGKVTLFCKEQGTRVTTPAGTFENCTVLVWDGDYYGWKYAETYFCPGVGIVRKLVGAEKTEWFLSAYTVKESKGFLPFAAGNRWEYETSEKTEGLRVQRENYFEVVSGGKDGAVVSHAMVEAHEYDETCWEGAMQRASRRYFEGETLFDVQPSLQHAQELAHTKRQRVHTEIAQKVMKRIWETDSQKAESAMVGRWNFFCIYDVEREAGQVKLFFGKRAERYHFEWKENQGGDADSFRVFYSFLYDLLQDAIGCVWSDAWVPGYTYCTDEDSAAGKKSGVFLEVLEDETVETPAGCFENCRHIRLEWRMDEQDYNYRSGVLEYWFAPQVGIVRFSRPCPDGSSNIWQLTDYRGTGEGYFPMADGFFRRYEPKELGKDWTASLELTFDEDESGMVLFHNAEGCQRRN